MDGNRFDLLAKSVGGAVESRRSLLRFIAGGSAGLGLGAAGLAEAEAKKKKKKCKKTEKKCNGKKQCCSKRCCNGLDGDGNKTKRKVCGSKKSKCCSDGGYCKKNMPLCCTADDGWPECTRPDAPVCCAPIDDDPNPDVNNGYRCEAGFHCCAAPDYCCADVNGEQSITTEQRGSSTAATPASAAPIAGPGRRGGLPLGAGDRRR